MAGSGIAGYVAATVAALTITAGAARSGPDRVSILLGSEHLGATRAFEEVNPGLVLTWSNVLLDDRIDIGLGAFRNSYGDGSAVVTSALPLWRRETWSVDLFGALAWYPGNGDRFTHAMGDVVLIGGAQARYRNLFVQAIPAGGSGADAVVSFGLTFALD